MPITTVVLTAPGIIALLIIARLAWRREAGVIREHLADEVPVGVLSLDEYERLPSQRARFSAEVRALRQHGLRAFFAQRDLHQAATELAFRKWHLSRGERPKAGQRRKPEDRYRQLIAVHRTHLL
jgi:hypothetical protein